MKEIKVSVNSWYVVEGTAGATVTNPSTNRVIATIEDGKQAAFYATTPYVLASDDSVSVYKSTFNSAPVKLRLLGLLGGGEAASALPRGYLAAEFLESTGVQYIDTAIYPNNVTGGKISLCYTSSVANEKSVMACRDVNRFYVAYWSNSNGVLCGWGEWKRFSYTPAIYEKLEMSLNFKNSRAGTLKHAGGIENIAIVNTLPNITQPLSFFALNDNGGIKHYSHARVWVAQISEGDKITHIFSPAIDLTGAPCMYDKVNKETFTNSGTGQFIVGMTMEQALNLSKLPSGGGTLTVSLPTGYESDAGVANALETARANGWTLTVRTYKAETAAATFGMRRIWVRKTQDENGMYVAADGTRWQVDWCVEMYTPDGSTPDMHGYELYRSVEAAVEYWELEPYVDPNAEERLTEYNANE